MSLIDIFQPTDDPYFQGGKLSGVVIAMVTNNQDPDGLGRVKLNFPWLAEDQESDWARVLTPMAGQDRGLYFLHEVEDEVLVAFEHGDLRRPIVLGGLWNGVDTTPEANDDGENNQRLIKSRSGHEIRLNDKSGEEKIEIIDSSGKQTIVIDAAEDTITITANADITIESSSGKLVLSANGIEMNSQAEIKMEASGAIRTMPLRTDSKTELRLGTVTVSPRRIVR